MATLYEYQTDSSGGSSSYAVYGTRWAAQTFTVGTVGTNENFAAYSVKLKVYKLGSPSGNFTVSLRETSAGLPTGSDLCSASVASSSITSGDIVEFVFSTNPTLSASTQYAIVYRAPSSSVGTNMSAFRAPDTPDYAGGQGGIPSTDSGSTWGSESFYDIYFEVYGDPLGTNYSASAQSLTLNQETPSYVINNGTVVTPSAQALSLTQQTPTYALISNPTVTPSALSLTLSTQNPTFNIVTPNYLQSKSIEYNNGTITSKTMTVTGTGILSFYMTADGSNYEQVTNGVLHTFVNTGQNLKYRIYGESGAEVTKVKIT
jgi:hypothetical protein